MVHVGVQQNSLLFSCQQFSNASITTSVDTTSQLLVVQLKRLPCNSQSCTYLLSDHSYRFQSFGGRSFKLDNYVSYPETIYLVRYQMQYAQAYVHVHVHIHHMINQLQKEYSLSGFVCHEGKSLRGGHYIAYIHNIDEKKWYQMDDEVVI